MRFVKMMLVLVAVLVAVCGCQRKQNTTPLTPNPASDLPEVASHIESGVERFVSGAENDISQWVEDRFDNSEPGFVSRPEDRVSEPEHSIFPDDRVSREESVAAAMSTDFKEIGALDAALIEFGHGGPTDDSGRSNGCTYYQNKFGKYDAYFIAPVSQKIYLTFDEGYENGYTAAILDVLKNKGAKAVFFITYPYAKEHPELVTRMVQEGHVLGNHSTAHKSFPGISLEEAAEDVMKLHDYVKTNFGYEMSLFRFPEGKFSEQTLALLQSLGYKSVFWSFAYKDYLVDNQPLTIEALNKITSASHPGGIYLLHAVSKTNAEVLDEVIDSLRGQGYTLAKWDIY